VFLVLGLSLLALLVTVLRAMPWHRPHPNHEFMLELLQSCLGEANEERDTAS